MAFRECYRVTLMSLEGNREYPLYDVQNVSRECYRVTFMRLESNRDYPQIALVLKECFRVTVIVL
jgi:hypothetical protein